MRRHCRHFASMLARGIAVALALATGTIAARAQSPIIAVGPPSFQSNDYPSFQTDLVHAHCRDRPNAAR